MTLDAIPAEEETLRFAGFWRRVAAAVLDGLFLAFACAVFRLVVSVAMLFAGNSEWAIGDPPALIEYAWLLVSWLDFFVRWSMPIFWLYYAGMESSPLQATLGKLALGLRVSDLDGRRIGFLRASGRHFGKYLSLLILFFGFLMAALTERKQCLHDILSGCLVLRR